MTNPDDTFNRLADVFAQSARSSQIGDTAVQWRIVSITCATALLAESKIGLVKRALQILPNLRIFIDRHSDILLYKQDGDSHAEGSDLSQAERDLPFRARIPFALWLVAFLCTVQSVAAGCRTDTKILPKEQSDLNGQSYTILNKVLDILSRKLMTQGGSDVAHLIAQNLKALGQRTLDSGTARDETFHFTLFEDAVATAVEGLPMQHAARFKGHFEIRLSAGTHLADYADAYFHNLSRLSIESAQVADCSLDFSLLCQRYLDERISRLSSVKGKSKSVPPQDIKNLLDILHSIGRWDEPIRANQIVYNRLLASYLHLVVICGETHVVWQDEDVAEAMLAVVLPFLDRCTQDILFAQALVSTLQALATSEIRTYLMDALIANDKEGDTPGTQSMRRLSALLLALLPLFHSANLEECLVQVDRETLVRCVDEVCARKYTQGTVCARAIAVLSNQISKVPSLNTKSARATPLKRKFGEALDLNSSTILSLPAQRNWHDVVNALLSELPFKVPSDVARTFDSTLTYLADASVTFEQSPDTSSIAKITGLLACARAGTLSKSGNGKYRCEVCDSPVRVCDKAHYASARCLSDTSIQSIALALQKVSTTSRPKDKGVDQSEALKSLLRLTRHCRLSEPACSSLLPSNPVISIVKRFLQSRKRVIRQLAGLVAVNFAMAHVASSNDRQIAPPDIFIPDLARQVCAADPSVKETAIACLGRLSLLLSDDLLFSALLPLVLQLGPVASTASSLALTELLGIARARGLTPYQLFAQAMPELSAIIMAEPRRAVVLPAFVDFVNMQKTVFLRQNVSSILPVLLTSNKIQDVYELAEACDTDVTKMVMDALPMTLAALCVLPEAEFIIGVRNLCASFPENQQIGILLLSCLGEVLFEILLARDASTPAKLKATDTALFRIDKACNARNFSDTKSIRRLLSTHALAILSFANDHLNDLRGKRTLPQKIRTMHGVARLIQRIGPSISEVSPQVMATLQSMLRVALLRESTLKTWHEFATTLKFGDFAPYVGQTSAAFASLWSEFGPTERYLAKRILEYLLVDNQPNSLHTYIWDIAEFNDNAGLETVQNKLASSRQALTFSDRLRVLIRRVNSENEYVCMRALHDLHQLLIKEQEDLHRLTAGDTFDSVIADALRAVMAAAIRGGNDLSSVADQNNKVRLVAFACLGALGAIDPDRIEMGAENSHFVLTHDFNDHSEAMQFAAHLMNKALVDAYRLSNDTRHQTGLGYAIQELLKFCQFTPSLLSAGPDGNMVPTSIRKRWSSLPRTTVEIVAPLLNSRFSIVAFPTPDVPTRPIYPTITVYRDWIRAWTVDLIAQVTKRDAKEIFHAFLSVVKQGDVVVSRQLIPHLVLHLFLADALKPSSSTEIYSKHIITEMAQVLKDQITPTQRLSHDSRLLCAQTVFDVLDHLNQWTRKQTAEWTRKKHKAKKAGHATLEGAEMARRNVASIHQIMMHIPQNMQAEAAFRCQANARALLNFENQWWQNHYPRSSSARPNRDDADRYLDSMHQIYAKLDEPDGMEGISTMIVRPDLWHQIREHESTGRWTAAQSCWEIKLQNEPDKPESHIGLLKCLRNLGHYDSMRIHIQGVLSGHPEWTSLLLPFETECALIIGDWQAVQSAVNKCGSGVDFADNDNSPELIFSRVVLAMRSDQPDQVTAAVDRAKEQLGSRLLAAGQESYRRSYGIAANLHALHEIELIYRSSQSADASARFNLAANLDARLALAMPAFRVREFLLNLRRTAFRMLDPADTRIGPTWLEVAKVARKVGHTQTAYSAILQAAELQTPMAFKEAVKLEKVSGQKDHALQTLRAQLDAILPPELSSGNEVTVPEDRSLAKVVLLSAKWMIEADRFADQVIAKTCRIATRLSADWENPHFILGHYFDGLYKSQVGNPNADPTQQRLALINVIKYFVRALSHGTKYIYQALPRLLTLYIEFGGNKDLVKAAKQARRKSATTGTSAATNFTPNAKAAEKDFAMVTKIVQRGVTKLPPWQWLTAYPQVVSRICQPNEAVQEVLESIMLSVLTHYPHHAIWAMISVAKSTVTRRAKRCTEIFNRAKTLATVNGNETARLINLGESLVSQLLYLCNFQLKDNEDIRMDVHVPGLKKLAPCDLIVPLQSSLTVTLPPVTVSQSIHRPFPANLPTWHAFENEIEIMSSLIRPRKITVYANDMRPYSFLCKPKDDLRKDARLMEFNSIINKLLQKDSESRKRHLHIRTYAVVPLNEECGLIEWVPNTVAFRGVLVRLYEQRNISSWSAQIKAAYEMIRGPLEKPDDKSIVGQRFVEKILPAYPPVFREWFLDSFPEPSTWLNNRLAYTRTAAVISMVGFVLGLGDRHGENILLDSISGDTVHVDFNCLFDKGRTFEVPEQVPFRLTQNIVNGMGITGVFRRACEVTMRILRANHDPLMSVLETFVHDPLVEWGRKKKKAAIDTEADEHQVREAWLALKPIGDKLKGLRIASDPDERLLNRASSVENQVQSLITEATYAGNLGSMYVGWCAHF